MSFRYCLGPVSYRLLPWASMMTVTGSLLSQIRGWLQPLNRGTQPLGCSGWSAQSMQLPRLRLQSTRAILLHRINHRLRTQALADHTAQAQRQQLGRVGIHSIAGGSGGMLHDRARQGQALRSKVSGWLNLWAGLSSVYEAISRLWAASRPVYSVPVSSTGHRLSGCARYLHQTAGSNGVLSCVPPTVCAWRGVRRGSRC